MEKSNKILIAVFAVLKLNQFLIVVFAILCILCLTRLFGLMWVTQAEGIPSKIELARIVLPLISVTCLLCSLISQSVFFQILDQNADQTLKTLSGKLLHSLRLSAVFFTAAFAPLLIYVLIR